MDSPREIRPGFFLVLALLALPLAAIVYFKSRTSDREATTANRAELAEMRELAASQTQALLGLRSELEQVRDQLALLRSGPADAAGPVRLLTDLNRRVAEMEARQSDLIVAIQRSAPWETVSESPERSQHQAEAGIRILESQLAEQLLKVAHARLEMDTLRTNLAVPDEIVVMESGLEHGRFAASAYRSYFEARRRHEELRRFEQILAMKLAAEKIDASMPRSERRVQP